MGHNERVHVGVFASGSSGNATVFSAKGTRVMVDAGVAPRTLARKMREASMEGALDAIVVTHAHGDHVGHSLSYAKRLGVPVYMSEATARATRNHDALRFNARQGFAIGALELTPTPLPHDAAQVALVVSDGTHRAAIATDLGEVPPALPELLSDCDVLLLESNHDPDMLWRGPYPEHLKRRIASARGHISNEQCGELLRALPDRAHTVVLLHLSRTNNRPEAALSIAREALAGRHTHLHAARQDESLVIHAGSARPSHAIVARRAEGVREGAVSKAASAKSRQLALPF